MTRRLADVARHVGVSQATVSRVLNDKPGISRATRDAVLTALDVLGYERPAKLRGERARLVGIVLPEMANPVFPALAEAMAGALAKRGFSPVLCTRTVDGVSEADYVSILLEQQVSGVLFGGGHYQEGDADHGHYALLRERSLPTVLVNAAVDGLGFPQVGTDDAHGTDMAYAHLAALGHDRIAVLLGPADHVPSARRLAAYLAARDRHGHDGPVIVGRSPFTMAEAQVAAARLIGEGARALICAGDVMAIGAIRAAHRLGLSVPGDVSVVGFDDSPVMACTDPPLTTIRQPVDAMGRAAVSLLLHQIEGHPGRREELLFEPELVVRASTGAAPRSAPRLA
ncbi:LacI family DNA-binding transcriptional regulator [Pseudosporangium ferrugineum]|uniref:LacI family transcriptional regulator n=1 Tax=Pseudosporangium ferrugineum TaxID=439699 RepID=A0A2T0S7F1_9ACTN|nr:LacI family DNA-binding transcriptional regulator [Pseudosporangium ferrugineum]PRY29342.1 LacI family transcriptional regulator [Pseudosporangium ferrugineum]